MLSALYAALPISLPHPLAYELKKRQNGVMAETAARSHRTDNRYRLPNARDKKANKENSNAKPTSVCSPNDRSLDESWSQRHSAPELRRRSMRPNGRPKISIGRHLHAVPRRRVAKVPLRNYR